MQAKINGKNFCSTNHICTFASKQDSFLQFVSKIGSSQFTYKSIKRMLELKSIIPI